MRSIFVLVIAVSAGIARESETGLLRFPTIHDTTIIFSYAGDLYSVGSEGGTARKLTSHEGYEMFPRFSPDGSQVAFTGQYDGNTEVYVMPAQGGIPKRLTVTATLNRDDVADRMGPNNMVTGWTPDGAKVVFRSRMKSYNSFNGQLFLVPVDGGLAEELPLPRGGFNSFSPDGKKLAYNRIMREFRTWKRYRGGMADDIWIYDLESKQLDNVTGNEAQDIFPMWHGTKIFFISDRSRRMNLFVYESETATTRQLTQFKDFDIKFPSIGPKAIVFENGGYIHRFDIGTERVAKLPILIADDFQSGRGGIVPVKDQIGNYEISPDGKRALVGARGDVFSLPAEHGPTRNITQTPGVHERASKWSPDGKWIAYISDRSGEDELYIRQQDGQGPEQQLTREGKVYKYQLYWSPDSKKIMWADREQNLFFVEVDSKKVTKVAHAEAWEIRDYAWSPDSMWIAFTMPGLETLDRVYLYSLSSGESFPVTTPWYESESPAFSDDGRFLFVVSDRDFSPTYGHTEWNHTYTDMERIFMIALNKKVKSPFEPRSDEVSMGDKPEEESANKDKKKDSKKKGKDEETDKKDEGDTKPTVEVDRDGLQDRIIGLPINPSGYWALTSADGRLYYNRRGSGDQKSLLLMFDFEERKETELGEVEGFEISHDNQKMLASLGGDKLAILDTPKAKIKIEKHLDLGDLEVRLNRRAEWRQIYHECWRQMRDFFYAPNMHGLDWEAERERYEPLLRHVNHRNDLTYLIGEMIGELNVGHAYVGGGDRPEVKRIKTGLLGAELERDQATGFYRIAEILEGESWDKSLESPLRAMGVDVNEGDFIIAVNGAPTSAMANIYESLINTVDKQVTLKVNASPSEQGAREVVVTPIDDESGLYYHQWVQTNIRKVSEATGGKVGYLHIPDMGPNGLNQFARYYYPQLRKKALIVDVRGNGGGNVSPMIVERLRREIAMTDMSRNTTPRNDPGGMILGPMVCLMDEFSASDGDLFPYRFKKYNLGKLIGKRSWGGVVGIRGSLPLLDGGFLMKPEFAPYDIEGKNWVIEGYGVDPDILVDNHPAEEYAGNDQQLNKGIEVILEELKTKERELAPIPPYPEKN